MGETTASDDEAADGRATSSQEDLIRSGPMTPQRAELEGETDVDFGPNCDPATGKVKLPTIYAPPCVVPFAGDNGGATSPGVTADSVKIVVYLADPQVDPVSTALIAGAGADVSPEAAAQTMRDYAAVFNSVFENYGRQVDVEFYTGTGASDDETAARGDAIAIAEQEPFAVIGGPLQVQAAFTEELAANDIISFPAQPLAESITADNYPLIWGVMTPTEAAQVSAEAIGSLAGPGPAELAGDPELQGQERSYAVVHYDTADGDQEEAFEALRDGLSDRGIDLTTDIRFLLDPAQAQEDARTIITRLKEAGITTVIFTGDFLMPQFLTTEATAQDYFPEWILGPNLLADTAIFGRSYDPRQWVNGFAIGFAGTPGKTEQGTPYTVYTWAYDREPPSNIYNVLEPFLREVFTGIHLAGPELTVESFRDGMLRYPPTGGGPTRPRHVAWGRRDLADLRLRGRSGRHHPHVVGPRRGEHRRGRQPGHRRLPVRQRRRAVWAWRAARLGRGGRALRRGGVGRRVRRAARGGPRPRLPGPRPVGGPRGVTPVLASLGPMCRSDRRQNRAC